MSFDKYKHITDFDQLELPQTIDEVNRIANKYNINISDYNIHIRIDRELLDEEILARTIFHEVHHQRQYAKYGYDNVIGEYATYERITRDAENEWWKNKGWQNEQLD